MAEAAEVKNPFLSALGERVRALRARRGLTRKAVAVAADVSERHLANLEYGEGNASILVLLQVAGALQCTLAELIGDVTTGSPEWLLLREMLSTRSEADLRRVREQISVMFGSTQEAARTNRIALIGLRGAGKTTWASVWPKTWAMPISNSAVRLKNLLVAACLLYTSPSPRDGLLSRMPSSA